MDGWMGVTLIGFIGKSVFLSALREFHSTMCIIRMFRLSMELGLF
jgi:hypothetical protein